MSRLPALCTVMRLIAQGGAVPTQEARPSVVPDSGAEATGGIRAGLQECCRTWAIPLVFAGGAHDLWSHLDRGLVPGDHARAMAERNACQPLLQRYLGPEGGGERRVRPGLHPVAPSAGPSGVRPSRGETL